MNTDLKTVRLCVGYTETRVGNPQWNAQRTLELVNTVDADVYLFPELSLTGYTCGDLFDQEQLLNEAKFELTELAKNVDSNKIVVVGLPLLVNQARYNVAAVLNYNEIVGFVPKSYLPNYKEFQEARWFHPASVKMPNKVYMPELSEDDIPFGTDILFSCSEMQDLKIGIEICEDLWSPIPPSSYQAIAGATLLLNLSASNELVGKADYRRSLVEQQSGRLIAAYAYASSGPTESTTDLVFGGHCLIAENGSLMSQTKRFEYKDNLLFDVDIGKLVNERARTPTFQLSQQNLKNPFRTVHCDLELRNDKGGSLPNKRSGTPLERKINPHPFVPSNTDLLKSRCEDIFKIQVSGLVKRMRQTKAKKFVLGVSGGLDSTLVALVARKAVEQLGLEPTTIDAVTMPGFGTSEETLKNAHALIDALGFSKAVIDIRPLCMQTYRDIGHDPFNIPLDEAVAIPNGGLVGTNLTTEEFTERLNQLPDEAADVVFENVQARVRTMLLMSRGFVLGTGDLSELALGWCTYGGDHMSMYNVNASIPKTLVKFLVDYVAEFEIGPDNTLYGILKNIVGTIISPELLPLGKDGSIAHSTESIVGPYELNDYFLYDFIKNNYPPLKIAHYAYTAFEGKYTLDEIKRWLLKFLKRFFNNQFKRSCMPDGPKVGSISLSPRGDWRMPSDADVAAWTRMLGD